MPVLPSLASRLTSARATNLDSCTYLEQTVPIKMNCLVTMTDMGATEYFIASNATGASGLISTDDTKVQKVFLLIIGRAVNTFDGNNGLACMAGTENQWQINLDGGAWSDLANEEADGQMVDDSWRCYSLGIIHPFTFMFDVTSQITNIDGKIGVRMEEADTIEDFLRVTCDIYLKIVWKL